MHVRVEARVDLGFRLASNTVHLRYDALSKYLIELLLVFDYYVRCVLLTGPLKSGPSNLLLGGLALSSMVTSLATLQHGFSFHLLGQLYVLLNF